MRRIKQMKKLLTNYRGFNKKEKDWIRNNMSPNMVKILTEIGVNLEKGNISSAKIKKSYRSKIKRLADSNLSLNQRRKFLKKQTGGFIGALISTALPLLLQMLMNK